MRGREGESERVRERERDFLLHFKKPRGKIRENNTGGTTELLHSLARKLKKTQKNSEMMREATENDRGMKDRAEHILKCGTEREQPSRGWLQDEQRALILTSSAWYCKCKAAAWICHADCTAKNEINKKRWKKAAVEAPASGRGENAFKIKIPSSNSTSNAVTEILKMSFNGNYEMRSIDH